MNQFYFRTTRDGQVAFHCSSLLNLLGYRGHIVGTDIRSKVDDISVLKIDVLLQHTLPGSQTIEKITFKSADSSQFETLIHFVREGDVFHCYGAVTTDAMDNHLLKRLNQTERTLRLSPGAIYQFKIDPKGNMSIPFMSENAYEIFGLERHEDTTDISVVFGRLHEDDLQAAIDAIHASAESLSPFRFEGRLVTPTGKIKWFLSQSVPEKFPDGTVLWEGILVDITQRKMLEEKLVREHAQLIHTSRLGELGKMAGSIAHEINNPLQAIQMNAERLLELHQEGRLSGESLQAGTELIIRTVERIGKTVRGLKDFCRDSSQDDFEWCSGQRLISDTLDLCAQKIKNHGIEIILPNTLDVCFEGNPVQLSQVLLSLLNNSFDAVNGTPGAWIRIDMQENGNHVSLSVTDSGNGLPENVLAKVMQPFFTTKPAGVGTGLGLSIALSIAQMHHGILYIDRHHPNTRFVIELPKKQPEKQTAA